MSNKKKVSAIADAALADSDESDSDYNPDSDPEAEKVEENCKDVPLSSTAMSASRKRKVNEIFDDMRSADEAATKAVLKKAYSSQKHITSKNTISASRMKKQKISDMLQSVYGRRVDGESSLKIGDEEGGSDSKHDENMKTLLRQYAANALKSTVVVETRKFAGQEITVEKVVKVGDRQGASSCSSKAVPITNLDKILEDIKGPQAISTVTKSVHDWENFKEKEGLEDDLAGASKDGYLHRQDFLQRCDVREHDNELAARPALKPTFTK